MKLTGMLANHPRNKGITLGEDLDLDTDPWQYLPSSSD